MSLWYFQKAIPHLLLFSTAKVLMRTLFTWAGRWWVQQTLAVLLKQVPSCFLHSIRPTTTFRPISWAKVSFGQEPLGASYSALINPFCGGGSSETISYALYHYYFRDESFFEQKIKRRQESFNYHDERSVFHRNLAFCSVQHLDPLSVFSLAEFSRQWPKFKNLNL